jgi:hypothetical protein
MHAHTYTSNLAISPRSFIQKVLVKYSFRKKIKFGFWVKLLFHGRLSQPWDPLVQETWPCWATTVENSALIHHAHRRLQVYEAHRICIGKVHRSLPMKLAIAVDPGKNKLKMRTTKTITPRPLHNFRSELERRPAPLTRKDSFTIPCILPDG